MQRRCLLWAAVFVAALTVRLELLASGGASLRARSSRPSAPTSQPGRAAVSSQRLLSGSPPMLRAPPPPSAGSHVQKAGRLPGPWQPCLLPCCPARDGWQLLCIIQRAVPSPTACH